MTRDDMGVTGNGHPADTESGREAAGSPPDVGRVVLSAPEIARALRRISHEILERNKGADDLVLLGIPTRGAHLARRLGDALTPAGVDADPAMGGDDRVPHRPQPGDESSAEGSRGSVDRDLHCLPFGGPASRARRMSHRALRSSSRKRWPAAPLNQFWSIVIAPVSAVTETGMTALPSASFGSFDASYFSRSFARSTLPWFDVALIR